jgi:nitrous oxidase accessory protein
MKIIITYFICFFFLIPDSFSSKLEIGNNKKFSSIHFALSSAKNGDTLLIYNGNYKEGNITIDKSVYLKGINYPTLNGEGKFEIISIKADYVTIDGFKIINSGISSIVDIAGIKVYNKNNVTIKNNFLNETFFGIYIQNGSKCTIENNRLVASAKQEQRSGNGIHCWKSDSLKVFGNNIQGHRDGIYFEFVSHTTIWKNHSERNLRYGLHFMFSNNNAYYRNIFKNNGAGVAVMFSKKIIMMNNSFEENWGDGAYGLLLKELSDCNIESNHFVKNTVGIFMEGTSRAKIFKNKFNANGWAMKIQASCMEVNVTKNNFQNNSFDVGTNGSLVLNKFNNNYWDKYEGYDIDKNRIGDIPYRPVSMYAMIIENNPPAMILFRSLITSILDKTEKIIPSLTPENLVDNFPLMKPLKL